MRKNHSVQAGSFAVKAGIGSVTGLAVTLLCAAVLAALIVSETADISVMGWGSKVIVGLSAMIGVLVANRLVKHSKFMVSAAACCGYYLWLLALSLIFGGGVAGLGGTALAVVVGGGIALAFDIFGTGGGGKKYKFKGFR